MTTTVLSAPRTVTATADSIEVTVRWRDMSQRETHYVVRRSFADGTGVVTVDTLVANTIKFQDTTSLDSGEYRYLIHAIGIGAVSASVGSNPVTIAPRTKTTEGQPEEEEEEEEEEEVPGEDTVTSIEDDAMANVVKAYPNPSDGLVSVYVGGERFAYIAVFNGQGRLISEVQQAEQGATAVVHVDLQHVPVGIYTLRIYTARGVVVKKITKQ